MPDTNRSSFLTNFARKRDLWWQFTVRAVELRHRGSHLGIIWSVLNPLLMLGLYMFVFGFIFPNKFGVLARETPVDFALALFLGLILYQAIAETLGVAPTLVVGNPNLVKKVVFPLDVLPLSQIGASWFHLLVSLALLIARLRGTWACSLRLHGVSLAAGYSVAPSDADRRPRACCWLHSACSSAISARWCRSFRISSCVGQRAVIYPIQPDSGVSPHLGGAQVESLSCKPCNSRAARCSGTSRST